jgi:hypothetical protein
VSRTVTSLAIVIALVALSMVGPCLACSVSIRTGPDRNSCCHHGGCEKPTKTPAAPRCSTPDVSLVMIERAWTQVAHAGACVLMPVAIAHPAHLAADESKRLPIVDAYSPPDLYLRNSVINI